MVGRQRPMGWAESIGQGRPKPQRTKQKTLASADDTLLPRAQVPDWYVDPEPEESARRWAALPPGRQLFS